MAEKIISPGVFTKEVDQSFLPAGVQAIGAAVIGPTVKGPVLIPTIVSSYSEYTQIFGDTFSSGSGAVEDTYKYLTSYSAQEYLKYADTLTVVRVADGADAAVSTVSSSTTVADASAIGSFDFSGKSFLDDDEIQITVGGVEHRFIASTGTIPLDASGSALVGGTFFFSGSAAVDKSLTDALGVAELTTKITAAGIGVTATTGASGVITK